MTLVGLMGGTFDPIHIGHLIAAETAREACGLDEVWFVPTNVPPLKDGGPAVSGEQRLRMVELAIAGHPRFRASAIELEREGVSYSVDTAEKLRARYPGHSFAYIIGADRVCDLPSWHRIDELAELVSFIGLERPGYDAGAGHLPPQLADKIRFVQMPQLDVSSTDIRARRKAGRSIHWLVPDAVHEYIMRNDLYGS